MNKEERKKRGKQVKENINKESVFVKEISKLAASYLLRGEKQDRKHLYVHTITISSRLIQLPSV
jgi:hypothetical protein